MEPVHQPPRTLLEAARILSGFTQSDLATALGIGQSKVSLLEAGAQRANAALVTSIATALKMPEGLLRRPTPAPHIGHLLRASLPRTALNLALSEVTMAHAHVDLLLDPAPADLIPASDGDPNDLARALRDRWSIESGPPTGMIPLLEEHGVVCVFRDLSDLGVAAVASTAASDRTLLFIDTAASRIDVTWTLAHELGHIVMTSDPSKDAETRADAFAVAFLLPEQDLRADDTLGSTVELAAAALRYGVRPRVLARRLRALKMVTNAEFRKLVHEARQLPEAEAKPALLGSPSTLADRVRDAGGSRRAAPPAYLAAEELRQRYLSRSVM